MKPSGNVLRVMNGNSRTSKPSRNFDGYFEEDNIKAAEDAGTETNQINTYVKSAFELVRLSKMII